MSLKLEGLSTPALIKTSLCSDRLGLTSEEHFRGVEDVSSRIEKRGSRETRRGRERE
jgi:hypothetical protein